MARFARDTLIAMQQATQELAATLGEETRELELRVGIHSGPTTGGVLRGDKGR